MKGEETAIIVSQSITAGAQKCRSETLLVYCRRGSMTKTIVSVVEPELDGRIQKPESLVGRYDNTTLIDTDFTDSFQFLALKRHVYIENHVKEGGSEVERVHSDFKGIHRSTILHLKSLPVFDMTGAAMQCTKLLINKIHNGSL